MFYFNMTTNQRLAVEGSFAFSFVEGVLIKAIREGKWVLLDEINLASAETLQRLSGLLEVRVLYFSLRSSSTGVFLFGGFGGS